MVSGRDVLRGQAVAAAIRADGGRAEFSAADLRVAGACDALIAATLARFGALDVLVNNAGILYTADALATGARPRGRQDPCQRRLSRRNPHTHDR
jgi:NAD(P)-dependent dehydrogenase (short-subunit alcohol dehydrogenase family)